MTWRRLRLGQLRAVDYARIGVWHRSPELAMWNKEHPRRTHSPHSPARLFREYPVVWASFRCLRAHTRTYPDTQKNLSGACRQRRSRLPQLQRVRALLNLCTALHHVGKHREALLHASAAMRHVDAGGQHGMSLRARRRTSNQSSSAAPNETEHEPTSHSVRGPV